MSRLLEAEPTEVLRAALRLEDVARAAWSADQAAARAETASWRGPAQRSFDAHLAAVRGDLRPLERGHAQMAEVLQAYAFALQEAQATARRAQQLLACAVRPAANKAEAEQHDALSAVAHRLMAEAEQQERAAADRAAARLREVAAQAPRAGRLAAGGRFVDDLGGVLGGSVLGIADMWVSVAGAVPWVNGARRQEEARHDLLLTAKESAKVWQPFVDAYRSAVDGRWGQTVGGLGAAIAFRRGGRTYFVRPRSVGRGQGAHAQDLHRRLRGADLAAAHLTSVSQRVDLLAHEAAGGHTLLQHVGRPDEYLAWRAHEVGSASSFRDERSATRAVEQALRARAGDVEDWVDGRPTKELVLNVDLRHVVGRGYTRGRVKPVLTSVVRVVLRPGRDGSFSVYTAFPLVAS